MQGRWIKFIQPEKQFHHFGSVTSSGIIEGISCLLYTSESGKGGDFHIKFEKYIAPSGMEKVRSVYWGFGTEGNSLTTDTFEATAVSYTHLDVYKRQK